MTTKFERLIALVTQGATVKDVINEDYGQGIDAIDLLLSNEQTIAVVVDLQHNASAGEMAKEYIAYHYDGAEKPEWLAQGGL